MVRFQQTTFTAQNDRAFDHVLQLAHVTGPVVGLQGGEAIVGYTFDADAMFPAKTLHELLRQKGNVFLALPQRRDVDRHHVQAEKQILPEFFALDALLHVAVGRGDDAYVHLDRPVAAHTLKFPFLQHAQQFRLDLQGDFADFIEKDGPVVREFETPFALRLGSRERTFFVSEKLAFNQVLRNGGAIQFYERGVGPGALAIERSRDQFLSRAAFARDQDCRLRAGDFADQLAEIHP